MDHCMPAVTCSRAHKIFKFPIPTEKKLFEHENFMKIASSIDNTLIL